MVFEHGLGQFSELVSVYPSLLVGYLFETSHFETLALFYYLDEGTGLAQTVVGTSVEPGKSALEGKHLQLMAVEIFLVDGGNLELAASTGLDIFGYLYHAVGLEV